MATATRTPTRTATRTPTATPTVTPNAPKIIVAFCELDRQHVTAHFVIWYTTTGPCSIVGGNANTYPRDLGNWFESAFNTYSSLGYQLPTRLPYQVYVVPIEALGPRGITFLEYTLITNDANLPTPQSIVERSALAAHEFFHAAQWRYQQACPRLDPLPLTRAWFFNEDLRWWMEATATWAQREAVPADTSYTSFIPDHLNNPWIRMDTRPIQGGTGIPYSPLFPFYLIEKLNAGQVNQDIIRSTWAQYQSTGNCGAMKPVIDSVLPPNRKIANIFPDYAEANYFLAYPPPPDIRADLRSHNPQIPQDFRPVSEQRDLNEQIQFVTGPTGNIGGGIIQPLATAYTEFRNRFVSTDQGRALKLTVNIRVINPSVAPVVRVWTIGNNFPPPPNAIPVGLPVRLTNQGYTWTGSITIPNFDSSALQWVGMQVVNPQTSGTNLAWDYRGEIIAPTPTPVLTNTLTATPASTATSTRIP
jgi:hypothetical protein